ncbi:histidine kinase [Bacteroidales bacterium 6E]|nr:histidine kinase [Bacteroidales bacterium 6E]
MKTYTSKRLAFYITGILTLIMVFFMLVNFYASHNLILVLISTLLFHGISYLVVLYLLNRFIADKIKPVYKTIRDLPVSGKKLDMKITSDANVLTHVRQEVEDWAKTQTAEIERLKDLERYRKEFVGNVSHELKTPIFNIQGYILTLLEGGIDDPKINKLYLQRTEKSIDRMISIVEDLESITKLESGEMRMNMEKFDIVKLVEDVFDMEQMLANERKVMLEFVQKPERPVMVNADKKRITEVVSNLVNNGIKYNKKKGTVHVSFYDFEDHILVEVADSGIGIDKKDLPRVFERFFRVDKSRSREQGGTGLGLSIVKHIIEAHDQTINVKSKVDEGTTFTFTLEKAR